MWLASPMLLGYGVQIYFYTKEAIAEGAEQHLTFFIGSFELGMSWQCCWLSKNITEVLHANHLHDIKTKNKVIINVILFVLKNGHIIH